MTSPASGSAHHQSNRALRPTPISTVPANAASIRVPDVLRIPTVAAINPEVVLRTVFCRTRERSIRSSNANYEVRQARDTQCVCVCVTMFVSPISTRRQQGLTHVVSQSPNSRPALRWLRRAGAVLRGARRLRGVAAIGDSRPGRIDDRAIQEYHPRRTNVG